MTKPIAPSVCSTNSRTETGLTLFRQDAIVLEQHGHCDNKLKSFVHFY